MQLLVPSALIQTCRQPIQRNCSSSFHAKEEEEVEPKTSALISPYSVLLFFVVKHSLFSFMANLTLFSVSDSELESEVRTLRIR